VCVTDGHLPVIPPPCGERAFGSTVLYLALLICTTIGISAGFWVLFVYVLQISSVRSRLLAASQWVNGALGIVLIGLGIRLWLSQAPGLS
jgi:threonine efflux protein